MIQLPIHRNTTRSAYVRLINQLKLRIKANVDLIVHYSDELIKLGAELDASTLDEREIEILYRYARVPVCHVHPDA